MMRFILNDAGAKPASMFLIAGLAALTIVASAGIACRSDDPAPTPALNLPTALPSPEALPDGGDSELNRFETATATGGKTGP